jgi:poly-beta-hydroxybutyrate-responsive repressor
MEAESMDREARDRGEEVRPEAQRAGRSAGEAAGRHKKAVEARPRNWLVPVILLTLREWNSYGYELMERATAFGFEAMNPGTLYRTLRQMEKDGIVESTWETSRGGPARRMYTITDAGEAYLEFWAQSLEAYRRNMDAFFKLYTGRSFREEEAPRNDEEEKEKKK